MSTFTQFYAASTGKSRWRVLSSKHWYVQVASSKQQAQVSPGGESSKQQALVSPGGESSKQQALVSPGGESSKQQALVSQGGESSKHQALVSKSRWREF